MVVIGSSPGLVTVISITVPSVMPAENTAFKNAANFGWFSTNLFLAFIIFISEAGFIMARKPGKLPAEVIEETYAKEYGTDTIQLHKDAISKDDVVLLHDDLLATGGTMAAAYRLVKRCGVEKAYVNFVIELKGLNGRNAFEKDVEVTTLLEL